MSKIIEQHCDGSGRWHRIGGPAIAYSDGLKLWCRHGKRHRRGGPAFFYSDGIMFWFASDRRLRAAEQLPEAIHPIMELFL